MVERANVIWLDESDKNKTNVIYMLIFPNWKYYIGQTTQKLKHRVRVGHSIMLDNPQTKKERAIKKYKTFHVMGLDNCKDLDELNVKEQYWIELYDTFKSGYNSTTGGDSYEMSDESRKKIGDRSRCKLVSDETRRKISESGKGKNSGRIVSDETRRKISEAKKGKKCKDRTKANTNRIKCKSIPDNIAFDSIKQCSDYYKRCDKWLKIWCYLDNGKIHKKSGQTFVRIKD